tara:strand:- start:333 stop:554 length:222 start_codon:yes stop_codon:yes gene_type:complete
MKLKTTFTLAANMIALPAMGFAEAALKSVPTNIIWIMNTLLFLVDVSAGHMGHQKSSVRRLGCARYGGRRRLC